MEITRGSLDEITRPANRSRPGSRVSLNSAGSYRFNLNPSSSLEILPPEDISQEAHDIEVEEFSSGSGEENDTDYGTSNNHHLVLRLQDSESEYDTASPDDPANNNEKGSEGVDETAAETDPDEGLDPKIAAAMRKMRQLDKILAKRVKREKEVKRQRLELHRQLQRELDGVKPEGRDEQKEIIDNTNRFLALVPPSSHNEGVDLEDNVTPMSPVFATQPLDNDGGTSQRSGTSGTDTNRETMDGDSTSRSVPRNGGGINGNTGNGRKGSKKNRKTKNSKQGSQNENKDDFIKRNIELATDAGNLIAMTDDEKKRLEDLLQEVEMLNDDGEEQMSNPYQLQLAPGVGYQPDGDEKKMLQDIDAKLMALMPSQEFMSICSTPNQGSSISGFGDISGEMFDLGEKVLQDTKQARVQQEKLHLIESELERMSNTVEQEILSPRISNERLADLLRQCDDLSSRATSATSSYIISSVTSPRNNTTEDIPVEVPRLPDDVLRHLLDEAKEAGITSTRSTDTRRSLSTVNEGESDEEDGSQANTGRSSQAGALVSYDMIQELLRNPRARSVASSDATPAIEYPSSAADQESPRQAENRGRTPTSISPRRNDERVKTPTSVTPRGGSSLGRSTYEDEALSRMSGSLANQIYIQDQRLPSQYHGSRNGHVAPYGQQSVSPYDQESEFDEFTRSDNLYPKPPPNVENLNDLLQEPPPKTRGQSRIAFAEANAYAQLEASTDSYKLQANSLGEITRPFRMPTPPQASNSSPSPKPSKPPSSSRSKKSKSRASSRGKSPLVKSSSSLGQSYQPNDLRLESISASASYSTVTRTDSQVSTNTSVSSSDFEYENDDEVQEDMLRATPGDDDLSKRLAAARVTDDADSPEVRYYRPQPKLNRGIHGNKPVLPVDNIHGIDSYAKSDDDSDKNFSPVFF